MSDIEITYKGETLFTTPINEGSKRKFLLMSDDYIILKFSLATPIFFPLGCQADTELGLFEVVDEQQPTYNEETGGYDYELKMEAYYMKLKNKKFRFQPEYSSNETSWNLTSTLDVHMGIFLKNLKNLGYTYKGKEYEFSIDDTVENKSKLVSYSNVNLIDALNSMVSESAFDCEWWFEDNIIHFGRCEYGTAVDFEVGKNLVTMAPSESKTTYATRIYAFGSTRNLPSDYRSDDTDSESYGVIEKRLMLPKGTPYVDAVEGMTTEEAVEDTVTFDDIYPRTDGEISEVSSYIDTVENEDGTETTETFYQFKDSSIKFSDSYILDGEELRIVFQSGKLNGMDFAVNFNPKGASENSDDAQLFEIVANEDYGRKLPDTVLYPQVGDSYVLYGWDVTKIADLGLIDKAEQELLEKAKEYIKKTQIDPNTYDCTLMSDYAYGLNDEGEQDATCAKVFSLGDRINLINEAYFKEGHRESRIIGFEFNLDYLYDSPVYTIGETASYSRLGEIESNIDELTKQGQSASYSSSSGVNIIGQYDTTTPTDRNVYSSLRSKNEFLNKKTADTANGKITFNKGFKTNDNAQFGDFTTGLVGGKGGQVDNKGNAEFESIIARGFIQTPELRFNRVDVVSGELWNAIAFGTFSEVDTVSQTATLLLQEGEMSGLKVNDICRGSFSNFGEGTQSTDIDECGFQRLYGFSTAYFTPVEILSNKEGEFKFKYAIKAGTSVHPMVAMKFAVYGNFTDKGRQASAYATRTYKRYLSGVSTWDIREENIVAQYGLLDGLTIGSVALTGYGSYQTNSYIRGSSIELTEEQTKTLKGESAYSVNLSGEEGVITVDDEGNVIGLTDNFNVISSDKNVTSNGYNVIAAGYKLSTLIQAFKGKEELFYSDTYGEGKFTAVISCVGCSATLINGVLTVLTVTDTSKCYIEIDINCEGEANFHKVYTVTAIKNGRSPITADLDNEMDAFASDSDGNTLFGLPVSTNATMWYGTTEMKISSVEVTPIAGVTTIVDGSKVSVTEVSSSVADTIPLSIKVKGTYAAVEYTRTLTFTVTRQRAGENAQIYQLLPSVSSIKVNEANERTVSAISCAIKATDGKTVKTLTSYPDGISIKYSKDGEALKDYSFGSIETDDIDDEIAFYLYSGSVLIDKENIPVIIDGKSNVVADLTNEMCNIACTSSGKYIAGLPWSTEAKLYYGSTDITKSISVGTVSGITASVSGDTVTITAIAEAVAKSVQLPVTLSGSYGGNTYKRTININIAKICSNAAYDLLPSVSVVSVNKSGGYSVSEVSCKVKMIDSDGVSTPDSIPSGLSMKYSLDGGTASVYTYGSGIKTTFTKSIKFELYQGSTLIDYETVYVVYDGTDGKNGADGKDGEDGKDGVDGKDGKNGEDGKDGADGESPVVYSLSPESMVVSLTRTGHLEPSSYDITLYQTVGDERTKASGTWTVFCSTDASTYEQFEDTKVTEVYTLNLSSSYKYYRIECMIGSRKVYAYCTIASDGSNGSDGESGVGISYITNSYALSSSSTTAPTSWFSSIQTPTAEKPYLWRKETITYTNGGSTYSTSIVAVRGSNGSNGSDGENGNGISSQTEYYKVSNSAVSYGSGSWTANAAPTLSDDYPYLWHYTYILYTNGTILETEKALVGYYGKDGASGRNGSMPTYRGVFVSNNTASPYVYNDERRDIVIKDGVSYQVKTYGTKVTSTPPSDDWVAASYMSFVAMDTALIDGANIAGWEYKNGVMQSATSTTLSDGSTVRNTILDGKTGKIETNYLIARGTVRTNSEGLQRVEMRALNDGEGNDLVIYDDSLAIVNRFSGDTKESTAFSTDSYGFSPKNNNTSLSEGTQEIVARFYVPNDGTIMIPQLTATVTIGWDGYESYDEENNPPSAEIAFRLLKYASSTSTAVLGYVSIGTATVTGANSYSGSTSATTVIINEGSRKKLSVSKGYYYVIQAEVQGWENGASTATPKAKYTFVGQIRYEQSSSTSEYFSNGLAIKKSAANYFMSIAEDDTMKHEMVSEGTGIRVGEGTIRVKHHNSSLWMKQPQLLYRGCLKCTSSSSYTMVGWYAFDSSSVTVTNVSTGRVKLTFASSNVTLSVEDTIVHAIGYPAYSVTDVSDNKRLFVTVRGMTSNEIEFVLCEDPSLNYGSFMFDIWKL